MENLLIKIDAPPSRFVSDDEVAILLDILPAATIQFINAIQQSEMAGMERLG